MAAPQPDGAAARSMAVISPSASSARFPYGARRSRASASIAADESTPNPCRAGSVEHHLRDQARPTSQVDNPSPWDVANNRQQKGEVLGASRITREVAGVPGFGERRILPVLGQAASVPSDSGVLISITSPKRWTVSIAS